MSEAVDDRLRRLLGAGELAALRRRLRRRFERASSDKPLDRIRIDKLSAEEHAALAALVGRPQRQAGSLSIDVPAIDLALRQAGIAPSLRDALERLDGPIVDLAATRTRQQALWTSVVEDCSHPDLASLLREPGKLGLLKRLARQDPSAAATLCRLAAAVLGRLPAHGITRSQLAAELLGDAHALDAGQPVATLVLAARRHAFAASPGASPAEPADDNGSSQTVERIRDIWAAAGVLVNELARPALFLNLPVARSGRQHPDPGEPGYLSLRALLRSPPAWEVNGRDVRICENPNLVAIAADRLGAHCAPLVCTDGMPAAAQRTLLRQLARTGARLHFHGDFDWPGLRIANHMLREHGAQPWRFGVADYLAAIGQAPSRLPSLEGDPVSASWAEDLTAAMALHRIAVAEEALADGLLQDLRSA